MVLTGYLLAHIASEVAVFHSHVGIAVERIRGLDTRLVVLLVHELEQTHPLLPLLVVHGVELL